MKLVRTVVLGLLILAPVAGRAMRGHDRIGCSGCHPRNAVPGAFTVPPNTKYLDPKTGQPYPGTTGVCLACHQDKEKGGLGYAPISRHNSHPFSLATIDPKVAKVPPEMLRGGRFECMSCHEPHPSNPNYKYLRVDVGASGQDIDRLCAICHPAKAGS